jgi:hypothetical protein
MMTRELRVTCTSKRGPSPEWLDAIGGITPEGTRWKVSIADAIAGIERGDWRFYVAHPGNGLQFVPLVIRSGEDHHRYLATEAGGVELMHLPECPIAGWGHL